MRLFGKEVKPRLTWRTAVTAVFCAAVSVTSITGWVYAVSKQVSLTDDDGFSERFTTYKATTAMVLAEKGIALRDGDEVSPPLADPVPDGAEITVNRAVVIHVVNGEEEFVKRTAKKTVADVLNSLEIAVGSGTILNAGLDDAVFEGMTIKVIHSRQELICVEEAIPFKITKKSTSSLKEGETRVAREGSEGRVEQTYDVYYENDKEVSRSLVKSSVLVAATDKVIEYGAPAAPKTAVVYNSGTVVSRGGEIRYKAVLSCSASAYSIQGRTATGVSTRAGVVAVDPSVIPLGSRLYIEAPDGSWTYGSAVAADTGGSIKGNKVDLFMESLQDAKKFGRRKATVYILD
ncbi:MAG: G5 domain-containing protein [Clostridiales bacterium]|nr:G5 domain-containing protein [Clostridiales bacterium]